MSDDEGGRGRGRGVWRVPLHASRWSARAQKSLFLPLCVSVLFPRLAANSFLPTLSLSPSLSPSPSCFSSSPVFLQSARSLRVLQLFRVAGSVSLSSSSRRRFSFFFPPPPRFQEYNSCLRCGLILKISLSLLGLSTDGSDVVSEFPARVTRARHAIKTTRRLEHDVPA